MTSSLVGSEMCIRDRVIAAFLTLGGVHKETSNLPAASWSGYGAGSTDAVSYTHLTLPTICSV
eukprot:11098005-Prorocentrum_lima.AAC.1